MKYILICIFSLSTLLSFAQNQDQYKVKVGDTAPDFTMQLSTGEWVKLSSLRGKVVMLQFTASWCGVCIKEMPHIEKQIWLKHKANPKFALFGIDRDEPLETVNDFIERTKISYPMALDPAGKIFQLYAEENAGITRNIIINKDGKIVMLTRLFKEDEFYKMVKLIDSLLK